jgi:hypothetical protein
MTNHLHPINLIHHTILSLLIKTYRLIPCYLVPISPLSHLIINLKNFDNYPVNMDSIIIATSTTLVLPTIYTNANPLTPSIIDTPLCPTIPLNPEILYGTEVTPSSLPHTHIPPVAWFIFALITLVLFLAIYHIIKRRVNTARQKCHDQASIIDIEMGAGSSPNRPVFHAKSKQKLKDKILKKASAARVRDRAPTVAEGMEYMGASKGKEPEADGIRRPERAYTGSGGESSMRYG